MHYVILAEDAPGSGDLRRASRPAHLTRLEGLVSEGRLLLAGPLTVEGDVTPGSAGVTGSLIVAEFESFEAARRWAEADPYRTAGVYQSVRIEPFKKVLP